MPRVLKEYTPRRGKGGRPQAYPWDKWLDGRIRRLVRYTDYTCTSKTIKNLASRQAERRKLKLSIYLEGSGKTEAVVIRPHNPNLEPDGFDIT